MGKYTGTIAKMYQFQANLLDDVMLPYLATIELARGRGMCYVKGRACSHTLHS